MTVGQLVIQYVNDEVRIGEEVTRQISDTFSGIISNAYQRAMKR